MVISDHNGNGSISNDEIIQSVSYYPYGMKHSNFEKYSLKSSYQYNGIEHVSDHDLAWDMAMYRSLDASIGRWGQVDPKAEATYSLTPYGAMNQNPISFSDPNGDMAWWAAALFGVKSAYDSHKGGATNFWDYAKNYAIDAAVMYASAGVGSAAQSMAAAGGNTIAISAFQAGAHGVIGGTSSALKGGNFGSGFAAGSVSSITGSVGQAAGINGWGTIGTGTISGGLSSLAAGGSFWDGAWQGGVTTALNHTAHEGAGAFFQNDRILPPINLETGKPFLPGFEDAEYLGRSKGVGRRHVWKLKNGKKLEWTWKNGVVEMYNKTGKTWLGKFNPITGEAISTTSKLTRVASFVGKGITRVYPSWLDFICIPCVRWQLERIDTSTPYLKEGN